MRQLLELSIALELEDSGGLSAAVVAGSLADQVYDWLQDVGEADSQGDYPDHVYALARDAVLRAMAARHRPASHCELLARLYGEVPDLWPGGRAGNPYDRPGSRAGRLQEATGTAWSELRRTLRQVRRESVAGLIPLDLDAVEPVPYLVDGLLAGGQPAVIAGPAKAGKTQLAVELACCLAAGRPYLGCQVPRPVRVALYSGESGEATLAGYCRDAGRPDGIDVYSRLPASPAALAASLAGRPAGVVILDPLYLLLDGSQTTNLIATARQLDAWTRVCEAAGATAVYVHHVVESVRPGRRPALEDITVAGTKQYYRQWLIMNRRVPFRSGEPDRLWVAAGGSAGHAAELEVDHTREPWTWTARPASRRDDAGGEARGRRARTRQTSPDDKILRVLPPEGMRTTELRRVAGLAGKTYSPAIDRLLSAGRVVRGPDGLLLPGAGEP